MYTWLFYKSSNHAIKISSFNKQLIAPSTIEHHILLISRQANRRAVEYQIQSTDLCLLIDQTATQNMINHNSTYFTSMHKLHMMPHWLILTKSPPTHLTLIRLLTRMRPHMNHQMIPTLKPLETFITLESPCHIMQSFMSQLAWQRLETCTTIRAEINVRWCVDLRETGLWDVWHYFHWMWFDDDVSLSVIDHVSWFGAQLATFITHQLGLPLTCWFR